MMNCRQVASDSRWGISSVCHAYVESDVVSADAISASHLRCAFNGRLVRGEASKAWRMVRQRDIGSFDLFVGGKRGIENLGLRLASLTLLQADIDKSAGHQYEYKGERRLNYARDGGHARPPIGRRVLILVGGLALLTIALLIGAWDLYRNRDVVRALLIWGTGAIAAGCGLLLRLLLLIPGTWAWWL